jgi:hypothetical protein
MDYVELVFLLEYFIYSEGYIRCGGAGGAGRTKKQKFAILT